MHDFRDLGQRQNGSWAEARHQQELRKILRTAFGSSHEIAVQASSDDVFRPDVMMGGHDKMRQHGLSPRTRVHDTASLQLGKLPLNSVGPQFAENVELALSGGVCPPIREIDDLVETVDRRMRFVDEALKALG